MGFWQLNWLQLKGRNNHPAGTKKNVSEVYRYVNKSMVDQTSGAIPRRRVGQGVIALRYSENTNWSRAWLDTTAMLVNYGHRPPIRSEALPPTKTSVQSCSITAKVKAKNIGSRMR